MAVWRAIGPASLTLAQIAGSRRGGKKLILNNAFQQNNDPYNFNNIKIILNY